MRSVRLRPFLIASAIAIGFAAPAMAQQSCAIVHQIGNNTTARSPFVTARDVVYFQGTDDKLWRVNGDGDPTSQWQIGTNTTKSTPFVFDDPATGVEWVYFQGTGRARGDYLWKVQGDRVGTDLTHIGTNKTASTPFVFADPNGDVKVYFQGTDNRHKLWKVNSDPSGSGLTQLGNNQTASPPFVFRDPTGDWVYFRGTDDRLLRVKTDGSDGMWLGGNYTKSTPFVAKDPTGDIWVYFQGTDDRLLRVKSDGTRPENDVPPKAQFTGIHVKSTPFVTTDGWVYFQSRGPWKPNWGYVDGPLARVFNDGSQLTWLTDFPIASSPKVGRMQISNGTLGEWVYFQASNQGLYRCFQPANALASGTVRPKFYVLTVLYAPPGTKDGKSVSLVDYSSESATGTKTSTESSWKLGVSLTAEVEEGKGKGGLLGYDVSPSSSDSSSLEIKKSTTFDIKVPGPAKDGIDHDHDVFVLMLNPLLNVTIYSGNHLVWTLNVDGPVMNVQYVYAGWLNNHSPMPRGVKAQLDEAGLGASDYQTILSTNPFVSGASVVDPDRFLPTPQGFAYEPPYSAHDAPWTETLTLENTVTSTNKVEVGYSVSAKVSIPLIEDLLKLGGSMEFTNTNSTETTTESKQSAAVTVGGPAFGYTGPTAVLVYWDTVYNSFMFAFPDGSSTTAPPSAAVAGSRARPAGSHRYTPTSR